jgi:hypothetical protein
MSVHVNTSGTWRDITGLSVRNSGTWRNSSAYVRSGGVWRDVGPSQDATWAGITNPDNQVAWSGATTLNTAQQSVLSWPANQRYFRAYIYGAGGGNSNGGQGAQGGYSVLYLAKSSVYDGVVLVVGAAGDFGNPTGPHTMTCSGIGTCNQNFTGYNPRSIGGRPGKYPAPHNWASSGGGFSGVFINDNNTTSPAGFKYWYCTPVGIAGGGGGGQAYSSNGRAGGGYSIPNAVHYQSPPAAFNSSNVVDINFTTGYGIDGNTQCYTDCALGLSYPTHPYLRAPQDNCGGGFAAGSSCQGGTGFIYGKDGINLNTLGFNRNAATLEKLNTGNLVHPNSFTQYGGGMGNQTTGRIIYSWGT